MWGVFPGAPVIVDLGCQQEGELAPINNIFLLQLIQGPMEDSTGLKEAQDCYLFVSSYS